MICALAFTVGSAWAQPSPTTEVAKLLEQGKLSEAAQRAQNHLKQNANDVQMRFLQGVIATEQRKYDQAIQIFTALTQDYPGLPEPYNNLAVVYAAKGEERKAAQVLEQAIRTNPSYATAHENLGDLYARMASDAYAKALQLDGSGKAMQPKLSLIKQIFPAAASTATAKATAIASAAPAVAAPVAAPAAPARTPAEKPVAAPTSAASAPVVVTAAAPAAEAKPAPVAKPAEPPKDKEAAKPAEQPVKAKETAQPDSQQHAVAAVEKAVLAWAKAWEQQNMAAYYAAYSNHFDPQGGTLAAWKAERKDRIVGKPAITVEVRDLKVSVHGERATANFRQYYAAGSYKATTRKTLRLQQEGDKWRITREETGR
jgi:colicin import membrane protein